jgi:HipA-like protein
MGLTSRFHKGPPPTLQILYQGKLVAALTKEKRSNATVYTFRYLPEFKQMKLAPLPGLPFTDSPAESRELWPFFAERIPDARRPEIQAWMRVKRIDEQDDIRLIAELGAHSVTDPFEIQLVAA